MFDAKKLLDTLVGAASEATSNVREQSGDVGQTLKDVLAQARAGVQEGAAKIDDKTGAGDKINEIVEQFGGGSIEDMVEQTKSWVGDNRMAAGGILGGLGALLLGTQTGRGLATGAAKLGGLVLIGGLAYKAYQNHQAGKPLLTSKTGRGEPAPAGSGFEAQGEGNDEAKLYIRAMIASAAADGHIDDDERTMIMNGVRDAGLSENAAAFLEGEFSAPASIDELVAGAAASDRAIQVYTAARVPVDAGDAAERDFLSRLAAGLGLDGDLVAHIDAEVAGVRA